MKKFIYIVLLGVSLSSCRIYSNYERPKLDVQMEQLYRDTTNVDQALKGDTINFGNLSWPDVFSDPHLQSLIRLVLEKNVDLRTADLTIQKAEAGLQVSRLAFFPSLSFSPSGTISIVEGGTTSKTYNIPLQASWQIDAFGSLRNAKKQSEYGVLAAKAARQSIQTALIASTANLYYTLEMLDAQLQTTKSTAALWDKNVEAMEVMMQAGMTN
ncbi:MAG: TolC family protein, partial [Alloprevotella tannerae]|nr:TolC family protein [Alloprevotella tannerae]